MEGYDTYITNIDGRWYAFAASMERNQVYSIGRDCPECGAYFAKWTDTGITYVASPSASRKARMKKRGAGATTAARFDV